MKTWCARDKTREDSESAKQMYLSKKNYLGGKKSHSKSKQQLHIICKISSNCIPEEFFKKMHIFQELECHHFLCLFFFPPKKNIFLYKNLFSWNKLVISRVIICRTPLPESDTASAFYLFIFWGHWHHCISDASALPALLQYLEALWWWFTRVGH